MIIGELVHISNKLVMAIRVFGHVFIWDDKKHQGTNTTHGRVIFS